MDRPFIPPWAYRLTDGMEPLPAKSVFDWHASFPASRRLDMVRRCLATYITTANFNDANILMKTGRPLKWPVNWDEEDARLHESHFFASCDNEELYVDYCKKSFNTVASSKQVISLRHIAFVSAWSLCNDELRTKIAKSDDEDAVTALLAVVFVEEREIHLPESWLRWILHIPVTYYRILLDQRTTYH